MFLQNSKTVSKAVLVFLTLCCLWCKEKSFARGFFMEGVRYRVRTMTSDSFQSDVIESKDAWILAIKGSKVSEDEWQTEENKLRGVVNVAFIDLVTDGEFMFKKGFIKKDERTPVAVVFPYGGLRTKKTEHKRVDSVKEAKRLALLSLSENYVSWIETKLHVETFVRNAYKSRPPRFPVVLTTEKRIIPPLYRAISIRYSKYFNFGIVHSSMAKQVIGLVDGAKVPRLDILIATITENTSMTFNGLTYDEAYGPVKYPYLIRFLYSAHNKHWSGLPGSKAYTEELDLEEFYKGDLEQIFANPESDKEKSESGAKLKLENITEIAYENHRKICDESTPGFCVVAFFDGSPDVFQENFLIFSEVHKIKYFQDKPLKFMWINSTCHPEFGLTFGVSTDSLPALLIAKPQRRYFVMHTGKFNKNSIGEFMDKVFTGRLRFSPYSRFPDDLEKRPCGGTKLNGSKASTEDEKQTDSKPKEGIKQKKEDKKEEKQNREEL